MTVRACLLSFALLVSAAVHASPPVSGELPATELERILRLAEATDQRWNERDAEGLAALYRDDASLAISSQEGVFDSRERIAGYFSRSFAAMAPTLRHTTSVDRLTVLDADHVLADTSVLLDRRLDSGDYQPVRHFSTLTVVSREQGEWKLQVVRAHALNAPAASAPAAGQR